MGDDFGVLHSPPHDTTDLLLRVVEADQPASIVPAEPLVFRPTLPPWLEFFIELALPMDVRPFFRALMDGADEGRQWAVLADWLEERGEVEMAARARRFAEGA